MLIITKKYIEDKDGYYREIDPIPYIDKYIPESCSDSICASEEQNHQEKE